MIPPYNPPQSLRKIIDKFRDFFPGASGRYSLSIIRVSGLNQGASQNEMASARGSGGGGGGVRSINIRRVKHRMDLLFHGVPGCKAPH